MTKKEKKSKARFVSGLIRKPTIDERVEVWKRMEKDDVDALMECSLFMGMCTKKDLRRYYKSKAEEEGLLK